MVLLFVVSGCGSLVLGDPDVGPELNIRNSTDVPVQVDTAAGTSATVHPDRRIDPGKTIRSGCFMAPGMTTRTTRVEAYDARGVLIFCEVITCIAVDKGGQPIYVDVVKGKSSCLSK